MAALGDYIKANPLTALVASNGVLAASLLWVASDGKPLKWLTRKAFQAVMSAVPQSVMGQELVKLRHEVEKSVLGDSLEDQQIVTTLPAQG